MTVLDASALLAFLFREPALEAALGTLRRHVGPSTEELRQDTEERWIVERGLQLCAQNCLDIAPHLSASVGHDVPDYASAIDELALLGARVPGRQAWCTERMSDDALSVAGRPWASLTQVGD